jgi:hypothetical protein
LFYGILELQRMIQRGDRQVKESPVDPLPELETSAP